MSPDPARPSHPAAAWVLGVLGVILVYFVSFPIVYWLVEPPGTRRLYAGKPTGPRWFSVLVHAYAAPYEWVEYRAPVGAVLERYDHWWRERLQGPPPYSRF
jgi:hypothetical protein